MKDRNRPQGHLAPGKASSGFTLIELMIVISIVAVLLALALPVYSNYVIRSKIAESLSVANAAVTAVSASCSEDRNLSTLNNSKAGYSFETGGDATDYVNDVQVSGECSAPLITVTSKNTGQSPAPVILLTGDFPPNEGRIEWTCSSDNTPDWLLPKTCRS